MTTATSTKSCANCKHWSAKADSKGECRRHAPQTIAFVVDSQTKIEARFPVTSGADWCGDYEAK